MSSLERIKRLERAKQAARGAASIPRDPLVFAESIGFSLDGWQRKLVESEQERIILNCSRQSGKSTAVAILALHHALTVRNAVVLILSPSYRQSTELFKKVLTFYNACERPIKATTETTSSLQLANGARIESLPGKEGTIRGFSGVSLLLIDEASRVDEDLYYAVRPMLAVSGGRLILLSTPVGKQGFFYREWMSAESWERYRVTADQCPRIRKEFLEAERRAMGEWWFNQEYFCSFEENETAFFSTSEIRRAIDPNVAPLFDIQILRGTNANAK